jgi:hypothetical protein
VLLGGRQGLGQARVLGLHFLPPLLEPGVAFAKLPVLGFELLAALFPAEPLHGTAGQST